MDLNSAFASRHDLLLIFEKEAGLQQPDVTVYCLGYDSTNFYSSLKAFDTISQRYDIVCTHAAHPIVMLPLIRSRRRCLIFQHGLSVSSGPFVRRMVKKRFYSLLPWLLNAEIICSTRYACQKSRQHGVHFPKKKTSIIPFGVPFYSKRKPARDHAIDSTINVGMAGNLIHQKRQDLVLESLRTYSGLHPIHLVIAGDGPERQCLESIAARITSEQVTVDFLGFVDNMEDFYGKLDLVVFPSRDESFGLVALEALSRTIPVAVFPDVGGCLPLIHHESNGFVLGEGKHGLEAMWQKLDTRPGILEEYRMYIEKMDLSEYDIVYTSRVLEHLALGNIRRDKLLINLD